MISYAYNNCVQPVIFARTAERLVAMMRLGIIVVTLTWLLSGKPLWFIVGAVSTTFSFLLPALIQDPVLRAAISLCVTALLFAHVVFGMQAGLYETSTIYDKAMHVFGCSAIAGIVIAAVSQYCARTRTRLPVPLLWVLAVGVVVTLGTLWEVFEFAIDRTGLFQSQRGLTDTMFDLIADTIGAVVTACAFVGLTKRRIGATT